ncbi:aminopeptidase [Luteitalea sp. TBR-22]|uniref:M20/M25/M40 family metallo-hydrolase n=1 Tax=Luteitalea sp. TBR-22 TaxID=2802971 RepID=UPI001AF83283|nr:M20/M25/M40 family metallo-hydrolase [Luteitalea sp. TBR-22]BCS35879.1 aminopeptidase [Luteitalea sp. TBR-22]
MPRPRTWRLPVTLFALAALLLPGCSRAGRFDVRNARSHVERLAGSIGSRWTGTPANEKARAYVIETLQLQGFDVRVQETDADWREAGVTTRVANIIAIKPGKRREAIGLVSHYDSVAWGPGAGDAALGTAVILEASRSLAARQAPNYTLMVIITDGEEHGLQGARALVDDPEVRARLKVFLNLEAIGTASPFPLFETGPGTSPALRAWAGVSRPRGGSYMQAIYDALPNDTDFSVLKLLPGVSGINFAATGDGYTYHTDRDRPDRVPNRVLEDAGAVVLEVVDGLDAQPSLVATTDAPMYFSLLDRVAFVWSLRAGVIGGWLVALLGVVAWLGMLRRVQRNAATGIRAPGTGTGAMGGSLHVIRTALWALVAAGAVLGALVGAVWLVRAGRAELHPWFAHPWRLFAFMTMMVVTVSWLVRRVATFVPRSVAPDGTPFGVWFAALPVWVALLVLALRYAPAASYLVSIPLLAAVLLVAPTMLFTGRGGAETAQMGEASTPDAGRRTPNVSGSPLRTWPARVGSACVAIITWVLWGPDLLALLPFVVTLLGRMPLVTPTWAYPAAFFFAGILLWPPVLAVLVGRLQWRVRHGLAGGLLMTGLVVTGLLAWMAPAYTSERPLQRSAVFVEDRVRSRAYWGLSSNEPGLDIGAGGPSNVAWRPAPRQPRGRLEIVPKAFLFRGEVPPQPGAAPAVISALVIRRTGDADVEITVTPSSPEWQTMAIVLPEDIVPTRSTLPGRTTGGRWQAWHTNVPKDGLVWRATVPASQADRLAGTEVWLARFSLPDARPGSRVPAWLETAHTAWMTQHVVLLPIALNETREPPAALTPLTLPLPTANPSTAAPLPPAVTPGAKPPAGDGAAR